MFYVSHVYCWQKSRLHCICLSPRVSLISLNLSKFWSKNLKASLKTSTRALVSVETPCFSQSKRALYGNFVIKLLFASIEKTFCAKMDSMQIISAETYWVLESEINLTWHVARDYKTTLDSRYSKPRRGLLNKKVGDARVQINDSGLT